MLKNLTMAASGRTMNDMGGGADRDSTTAALSPKSEPNATAEKVLFTPRFRPESAFFRL